MGSAMIPIHGVAARRFALCLGMAIALHAAVMVWAFGDGVAQTSRTTAMTPLQVGLIRVTANLVRDGQGPDLPTTAPRATTLQSATPGFNAINAPKDLPTTQDIESTSVNVPLPSLHLGTDHYVPRSELTAPPRRLGVVPLVYPDDGPSAGLYVGRLALLIDEFGSVRRVEPLGRPLPPALESAARLAFLGASFSPGEIEGAKVKSRIHIEVTFEQRPPVSAQGGDDPNLGS